MVHQTDKRYEKKQNMNQKNFFPNFYCGVCLFSVSFAPQLWCKFHKVRQRRLFENNSMTFPDTSTYPELLLWVINKMLISTKNIFQTQPELDSNEKHIPDTIRTGAANFESKYKFKCK